VDDVDPVLPEIPHEPPLMFERAWWIQAPNRILTNSGVPFRFRQEIAPLAQARELHVELCAIDASHQVDAEPFGASQLEAGKAGPHFDSTWRHVWLWQIDREATARPPM
jgi:hypothetical protein